MSELALTPSAARSGRRTSGPTFLTESATLVGRALRLSLRDVEGLITAVALPVMLMVIFVELFGGAISTGTSYVNYVVPGVLLICIGFGAGTTAVSVAHDLTGGIMDRFRSMDVRGEALIQGQVVASVARNLLSTALVIAVAFALGFAPHAGVLRWLAAVALLTLFVVALSWLAAAIGILAKTPEAANGITFLIAFLAYPSSAIVPVHTMPSWLQGFAAHQPETLLIDSIRALLLGGAVGATAWQSVAWSLAIIVVSVLLAGVLYRRRTR